MSKLKQEQIQARMAMYDEAIEHMGQRICDTDEERIQAGIVAGQILTLANQFARKYL